MRLVLASSSPFRKTLLERLGLPFETFSTDVDETPLKNEDPHELVARLAMLKAQSANAQFPDAACIGCDTLAFVENKELGKPFTFEQAVDQLKHMSGQKVTFLTAVCLHAQAKDIRLCEVVPTIVQFRELTDQMIEKYLIKEQPYYSSGSFKSETSACTLISAQTSDDPTAIIGLPLIQLCLMLEKAGLF